MTWDFAQLVQVETAPGATGHEAVRVSDEDRWIDVLGKLHHDADAADRWGWLAAGFLLATPSFGIRNAAALALADMGAKEAGRSIVEALRRPDVAKHSGTLLYALSELGASVPLGVLVGLIENASYEGRAMALIAFEDGRVEWSGTAGMEDARARLTRLAQDGSDPEGAEAARWVLDHLDGRPAEGD